MFDSMPLSLKKEVKIENYIKVIKNSPQFGNNYSIDFLNELAANLEEQIVSSEEFIFRINDQSDNFIILLEGIVNFNSLNDQVIEHKNAQCIIGYEDFLFETNRSYNLKSQGVSKLAVVTRDKFMSIIV